VSPFPYLTAPPRDPCAHSRRRVRLTGFLKNILHRRECGDAISDANPVPRAYALVADGWPRKIQLTPPRCSEIVELLFYRILIAAYPVSPATEELLYNGNKEIARTDHGFAWFSLKNRSAAKFNKNIAPSFLMFFS